MIVFWPWRGIFICRKELLGSELHHGMLCISVDAEGPIILVLYLERAALEKPVVSLRHPSTRVDLPSLVKLVFYSFTLRSFRLDTALPTSLNCVSGVLHLCLALAPWLP